MRQMNKREWLSFVLENRDKLISEISQDPVAIRNVMAESGVEVTPAELSNLIGLIKDTIHYLDSTIDFFSE